MLKINLTLILLILGNILFAQDVLEMSKNRPLNNINVNLLGDGSLMSFSYERQKIIKPTFLVSGKFGLGYNEEFRICLGGCSTPSKKFLTVPYHLTANFGKTRHFIELGLGTTIYIGGTSQPNLIYPIIGYRFLPFQNQKFNFRIFAQYPFAGTDDDEIIFSPFGASAGMSF